MQITESYQPCYTLPLVIQMSNVFLVSPQDRRDLWFARFYYLFWLGGLGFILPFINLFYVSLGLKGTQIGVFAATGALVSLAAAPLIVSKIKQQPQPRRYLQLVLVLGALGYFLIQHQTAFLPIVILVFFHTLALTGISPLSDTVAVSVAQGAGTGFGSVRVWASAGWIISVLSAGWLIERLGFSVGFWGASVVLVTGAILLFFIRPQHFTPQARPEQASEAAPAKKHGLRSALELVLHDRPLAGLALALVVIGLLNNGVMQFQNVYLAELGASKQMISLAGTVSAMVEIPFMILADRLVRRYGAQRLLLVSLGITVLYRLLVFIFPSVWTIVGVNLVGGVTFSLYTIAFISLISSRTPPEQTGTVLALFASTLGGTVNIVASPVAGALFDAIGARWLYGLAALGYLVGTLSLWLAQPKAHDQDDEPRPYFSIKALAVAISRWRKG